MKPVLSRLHMPRSLFVRALLILLLPMVLLQLVVGFVFIQRHYEGVTEQMARAVARDLNYAAASVERAGSVPEARAVLDFVSGPLGIKTGLFPDASLPAADQRLFLDLSGRALIRTFGNSITWPVRTDLASDRHFALVEIETSKGILTARIARSRVAASNPHQLLVLMVFTSLLLSLVAVIFLRNQIRPIRDLAQASEEFGKGRSIPYRPRGATEVRRAGQAFLSMRGRIERQIEQRTQMLSAVSHDLRTPLTRMKLALSLIGDPATEAELGRDVEEMQRMVDEFLAFARGDNQEEPQPTDPLALAREIVAGTATELRLDGETAPAAPVSLRQMAVRRSLQNLTGNALRFGSKTRLTVRLLPASLDFVVEDNGPGIPEDQREMALRPFTQLDPSRNRNTHGGVGLGLAIALDAARSQGGDLVLGVSEDLGGLKATLHLPR